MNAIQENDYTLSLSRFFREKQYMPRAIVMISAHYTSQWKTSISTSNRQIYDFYGFPKELSSCIYQTPPHEDIAQELLSFLPDCILDASWWVDHGAWSPLIHIFPEANIPVVQLSIDMSISHEDMFTFWECLRPLREQGFLILWSGNIVHNLWMIDANPLSATPPSWAYEWDRVVKKSLIEHAESVLLSLSVPQIAEPTGEHIAPLYYLLGARYPDEEVVSLYDGWEHGNLSLFTFWYGVEE